MSQDLEHWMAEAEHSLDVIAGGIHDIEDSNNRLEMQGLSSPNHA